MNRKMLRVIIASMLACVFILGGTLSPALAITNGQPDGDNHPYVCLVVFDADVGAPGWRTTGILIAPQVVLTAGHGTDGAVAARVYFNKIVEGDTDYPFSGENSTEGTPYTYPGYTIGDSQGRFGFSTGDIGIVILDEPVYLDQYGELPEVGFVDTLAKMTDVDLVGYGVQELVKGDHGRPYWTGEKVRLCAPAILIDSYKASGDEIVGITANPGQDRGGATFGDSGGPVLLQGTNTILAVHSYVNNYNAAGVTNANRVDIADILDWIAGIEETIVP